MRRGVRWPTWGLLCSDLRWVRAVWRRRIRTSINPHKQARVPATIQKISAGSKPAMECSRNRILQTKHAADQASKTSPATILSLRSRCASRDSSRSAPEALVRCWLELCFCRQVGDAQLKAGSHTSQGGKGEVALAPLDRRVIRAMHLDRVSEAVLTIPRFLACLANRRPQPLLHCRVAHARTVDVRNFAIYTFTCSLYICIIQVWELAQSSRQSRLIRLYPDRGKMTCPQCSRAR